MGLEISFSDKVVLVTGASTGIGHEIARAFGQAGARVALNDLEPTTLAGVCQQLSDSEIECYPFVCDVRDADAVRGMVDEVVAHFGRVDVLVANAGVYPVSRFLDLTEKEWDRVMDTNLKGVFLSAQAVAQKMVTSGNGGHLITIASGAANRAILGWSHYCTSKAGVVMLTRAMALELAGHGIRVNAILPGYIDVERGGNHLSPGYKDAARRAVPLERPGTPMDVARAALLLASPLADYVTGTALTVDGGSSAGNPGLFPGQE